MLQILNLNNISTLDIMALVESLDSIGKSSLRGFISPINCTNTIAIGFSYYSGCLTVTYST